jgi:uncharacterized protein YjiS (DUF1127 family)
MTIRSQVFTASPASLAARQGRGIGRFFTGLANRLAEWHERSEQRFHLAGMDDRMLKDIGVSSVDAVRESSKPFWKA